VLEQLLCRITSDCEIARISCFIRGFSLGVSSDPTFAVGDLHSSIGSKLSAQGVAATIFR